MKTKDPALNEYQELLTEIRQRIFDAWHSAARAVNAGLIALYWDLGRRIAETQATRPWGERVVEMLAKDLKCDKPGPSFSERNLWHMRAFWQAYSAPEFLKQAVSELDPVKVDRQAGIVPTSSYRQIWCMRI